MDGRQGALANSLQFRLALHLCLAIVAIAAAAGAITFASALDEAHQLQDKHLQQVGFLVSRLDAVPASPMARERAGDIDFDARVVVRFLPADGAALAASHDRPPVFSNLLSDGLQTVLVGQEQWRVFVRTNAKGARVAVGQQTTVRDTAARSSAIRALTPVLFLIPVLVLLVGALVRQMFKPLKAMADDLGRRRAGELGPLDAAGLPSEVWPIVAAMNQLFARVSESMAAQRRFIAGAAHELRTPLTAMSLQAERLGAAEMPAEARSRLDTLAAGLQRARLMLEQLLALARTQELRVAASSTVSLRATVREVLEDAVPIAEARNIDLGVVGEADGMVLAAAVDLKVLVKNVCDNAVRYTPPGGRVDIAILCEPDALVLQVDDTGPGIAPDERERVFDAFYRIAGNGEAGSGLGLAICHAIAERIGASIVLGDAPAPAGGLRVRVQFPPVSC
jgi:two-component system OmpR family sensor kinase